MEFIDNNNFRTAQLAFESLPNTNKRTYVLSAITAISELFKLEPRMLNPKEDLLEIGILSDSAGKDGDVRDILISCKDISWEIGLSLKHNNFAVKHNRLSQRLDFGKLWYGTPCSKEYWDEVGPVFSFLSEMKYKGILFDDIIDKDAKVYIPILTAFMNEIKRQSHLNHLLPALLVEYLLGKYDFYKIISMDSNRTTRLQCFNLHGTLGQGWGNAAAEYKSQIIELPTRIVAMEFKPGSTNTIDMFMDKGWQFSFRIHNGEKIACPTLKFDIQIVGIPTTLLTINCVWR